MANRNQINPNHNNRPVHKFKNMKTAMWFLITAELLGVFLCFLSIFNTYRDIYTHDDIKFGDLFGMFDDTIYTIGLTEKPEEIYSSFYMAKVGDNALLVMCEVTFFEQGLADLLKERCGFEVNVDSVF